MGVTNEALEFAIGGQTPARRAPSIVVRAALVKDRMDLTGTLWRLPGANAVLKLLSDWADPYP